MARACRNTPAVREQHLWNIALLPIAGLFIGRMYHYFGRLVETGNNLIVREIHAKADGEGYDSLSDDATHPSGPERPFASPTKVSTVDGCSFQVEWHLARRRNIQLIDAAGSGDI